MIQTGKRPKNEAESEFFQQAVAAGWRVTKQGWPDFFCVREGKIALVEVKPKRSHNLKRSQYEVMQTLATFGVPCYRWDVEKGFVRLVPDMMGEPPPYRKRVRTPNSQITGS